MLLFFSCRNRIYCSILVGFIIASLEQDAGKSDGMFLFFSCSILVGFITTSLESKTRERATVCFCSLVVEVGFIVIFFLVALLLLLRTRRGKD